MTLPGDGADRAGVGFSVRAGGVRVVKTIVSFRVDPFPGSSCVVVRFTVPSPVPPVGPVVWFVVFTCRDGMGAEVIADSAPPPSTRVVTTETGPVVPVEKGATVSSGGVVTGTLFELVGVMVKVAGSDEIDPGSVVGVVPVFSGTGLLVTAVVSVAGVTMGSPGGVMDGTVVNETTGSVVLGRVVSAVVGTVVLAVVVGVMVLVDVVTAVLGTVVLVAVVTTVVGVMVLVVVVKAVVGTVVRDATVSLMTWLDDSGVEVIPSLQYQTTMSPSPTV